MSAESCAADSPFTRFSIFGHWNRPSSRRFANRHTPVPSQNKASPDRRAWRGKHRPPRRTIRPPPSRTSAAGPSGRLRKSTGRVATSTRTAPTGRSLGRFQRADNRRHHRDLGAEPDPDARRLNIQFDDAGMPIRRFALNAALKRRRRSDASTTTGANGRSPISSSASRPAWRRQATNCCCVRLWRRATWLTWALPSKLSPTIAAPSAQPSKRRRPAPVKMSSRRARPAVLDTSLRSEIDTCRSPKRPEYAPPPLPKKGARKALTRRDSASSTRRQPQAAASGELSFFFGADAETLETGRLALSAL